MRKALLVVLILCSAVAWATGGACTGQKPLNGMTTGGYLKGVANASVRVCSDTLTPCTTIPLYSDAALTQAISNPVTSDATGNYQYCAVPGTYNEQISGSGISGSVNNTPVTLAGSGDVTQAGANTLTGTNTFTGTTVIGSGLPRLNAAIANVKKGTGFARIGTPGDSTSWGSQATVATSYPVDVCNDLAKYNGIRCTWSTWIGAGLSTTAGNNFGTGDPRIVMGSGWAQDAAVPSVGGHPYAQSASGGAFTFTPTQSVDTFEVYYIQQPSGGVMSVSIDGGAATLINTAGIASMQKATLTAASAGTHTISHSWSSGGKVDLVGDIAYDSTTPSVIMVLMGAPSANAAQLADQSQPYGPGQSQPYSVMGLDAVVLEDGINDWIQGVTVASFTTSMTNLVTSILAAGSDLAVFTPVPSNPGVSSAPAYSVQKTYVDALRSIAYAHTNANGAAIPVIDNNVMWGTYAASIAWYSSDGGIHPSATGYQANATAVESVLLGTPAQVKIPNVTPFVGGTSGGIKTLVTSGSYTVIGTEKQIYVNSGATIVLPASVPDSVQMTIYNFDALLPATISCTATTCAVPTSLPARTGILIGTTGGTAWWAQVNPVPQINPVTIVATTGFAGEVALAVQGLIGSTGDTFQRADSATTLGTSASGQAWTNGLGIVGILSKQAYLPSATSSKAFYNSGISDGRFLTSFPVIGTSGFVLFRYSDASNFWAAGFSGTNYKLRKIVAGVQTDVFTSTGITPTANDRVVVSAVGSSISLYLNGTLLVSVTDSFNSTATNVGLWSADTTTRWALVAAVKP